MEASESKERFKRADTLFRAGEYQQALHILSGLNQAHPNTKNVLYPMAMCLERLGRADDALPLCVRLIEQFQDPRAQALKDRIAHLAAARPQPANGLFDLDYSGLDDSAIQGDLLDIPTTTLAYKPVEPDPFPWLKYTLIGLGVAAILALIIVPVLIYEPPPPGSVPDVAAAAPTANRALIYLGALATFVVIVGFQTLGGYIALMLMRSLPYEDMGSNVFNISASVMVATVLESSFFGFFLTTVWFSKAYDLGFGGICFFYLFRIVFFIVGLAIGMAIFASSLALALKDVMGT
jgi:hypothetical protein